MTYLIFNHSGWTVATASWTMGSKKANKVTICYLWGDGFGWSNNATGTASIDINMTVEEFLQKVQGQTYADLRPFQD